MKENNFLCKNKNLAKPLTKITKVHANGTALIRTKTSKHELLVNTNLLVKYNKPIGIKENKKQTIKTLKLQSHNQKSKQGSTINEFSPQDQKVGQLQEA
jgi:hypothetical protein